jgi:hypothetical protein
MLDSCAQLPPKSSRGRFAQGFFQSRQKLWVPDGAPANLDDCALVKQKVWMARPELRYRGFSEIEIRATRLL